MPAPDRRPPPAPLDGFLPPEWFADGAIGHWLYVGANEGPAVLLMHELPGLTPECIALARTLGDHGFRVYLPLLFGRVDERAPMRNTVRICVRREIWLFARNRTSPLVRWLRALVHAMSAREARPRVGVIGMCLTGGFALGLVAEPTVGAAVTCQPSLPLVFGGSLGLAPADVEAAATAARARGACAVRGYRYASDWMCPSSRFAAIEHRFGDAFCGTALAGNGHATLTAHLHPDALDDVVQFLTARLGAAGA